MPVTRTITLYSYDELSEKAKETAVERLYDLNVDHEWWDCLYQDAATIGIEIEEFDTYRCTISGKLTESLLDCCKLIRKRKHHGKDCETFKTAQRYLAEYVEAFKQTDWSAYVEPGDDWKPRDWLREFEYSGRANEITNDFRKALLEDYLVRLRNEYDYLMSPEQIVESIRANEYLFTESGHLD